MKKFFSWGNNAGKNDNEEKRQPRSAANARDRLQIIIIEDRKRQTEEMQALLLDKMRQDIINVVQRYIRVQDSDIEIIRSTENNQDILELNINIQDREIIKDCLKEEFIEKSALKNE